MTEWHPAATCPDCGSDDTNFIESRAETIAYECNACGCKFDKEQDD